MIDVEPFKKKFSEIKEKILNNDTNDFQELIDLEEDLLREYEMIEDYVYSNDKFGVVPDSQIRGYKEMKELKKLLKDIKKFNQENNEYDEDDMLNMMFPNRGDDDFDEDNISYDNGFGDD